MFHSILLRGSPIFVSARAKRRPFIERNLFILICYALLGVFLKVITGKVCCFFRRAFVPTTDSARMMSDYKVEMINDGMQLFYVHFHGPNDSKFHFPVHLLLVLVLLMKFLAREDALLFRVFAFSSVSFWNLDIAI